MIKAAIDRILYLAPKTVGLIKDEFDCEYTVTPNKEVMVVANKPPQPSPLELHTLKGICDIVQLESLKCSVHIVGPRSVSLISKADDKWKIRDIYAVAGVQGNPFPFGRELDIETFIIAVQCHFVDTPAKKEVIDFVSSIFASEVKTASDDGIAQTVITENAVGRKEKTKMDPIIKLRPWRTFREIEQPEDSFLIRAHRQEGSLPLISMRSAGGEMWKHEAIESIRDYLSENMPEEVGIIR